MPADRKPNGLFLTSRYSENYQNNLTYPINPVFDLSLWRQPGPRECLEPVLRLASVLFESPASQRLIYSRLYTEHVRTTDAPVKQASCHFRRALESEDKVDRGFREATLFVARRMKFEWTDELLDAFGMTTPSKGPTQSTHSCIIQINRPAYKQIFLKSVGPGDDSKLSRHRFHMAVTLCHEVAHALDFIAPSQCRGALDYEHYFFESSQDSEFGFAWEFEVFSFTVEEIVPHGQSSVNLAVANPVRHDHQVHAIPRTPGPPTLGLACYVIPIDYITRIQRENFWNAPGGL